MDLCRHLRWKSFYGAGFRSREEALALASRNDVPFSCLATCRSWGPDDGPATPEDCSRDRSCYEDSPLRPAPSRSVT